MDAGGFVAVLQRLQQGLVVERAGALQEPEAGGQQAGAAVLHAEVPAARRGLGEQAVGVGVGEQGEFLAGKGAASRIWRLEFAD